MFIYLFRDENESENFAFSIDMTGGKHSSDHATHRVSFLEAINTLKFVEPWDIGDFRQVLEHLKGGWVTYYKVKSSSHRWASDGSLRRSAESGQLVPFPPHCLWRMKGEFSTGR